MAFEFPNQVDAVTDVPEKYRPFYAKGTDGKFILDEEIKSKTDNTGLVSALDKERKAGKEFQKQLAGWKGLKLGESPEEAMELIKQFEDTNDDEEEGATKDKNKKLIQKLKADTEAQIAKLNGEHETSLSKMKTSLKKEMIDSSARAAIAELKGAPDLLLPHVREQCALVEEDGAYKVQVVDAEGDPRGNGKGGFMTIKDLVAEMRQSDKYGRAFEASGTTGSGKPPGAGNTGTGGSGTAKLSPIEKIARGLDAQARR